MQPKKTRTSKSPVCQTIKFIICSLIVIVSHSCGGNDVKNSPSVSEIISTDTIQKQTELDSILVSDDTTMFYIQQACGEGSKVSEEFREVRSLIKLKHYESLTNNLVERNPLLQMLSVIALEELSKKELLEISASDLEIVKSIKSSKRRVHFCQGCTVKVVTTVSGIFEGKCWFDIMRSLRHNIGLE
jgi:hypothetical protein